MAGYYLGNFDSICRNVPTSQETTSHRVLAIFVAGCRAYAFSPDQKAIQETNEFTLYFSALVWFGSFALAYAIHIEPNVSVSSSSSKD